MDSSYQDILIEKLRKISPFLFLPNYGNLGDLLLTVSTRQFFKTHNIPLLEYDPDHLPKSYNLVFAGGGRLVPHYGDLSNHIALLTDKRINSCIILPHSIYNADSFVRSLDQRHTVFCREQASLDYCLSINKRASFIPGNDMALSLNSSLLHQTPVETPTLSLASNEKYRARTLWNLGFSTKLKLGVWHSSVSCTIGGQKRNAAFLLRADCEKSCICSSLQSFDISNSWNGLCYTLPTDEAFIYSFIQALSGPDIIVTDRLHAGIAAIHAGKEVYLLDNDYGKLSGVYHQSLKNNPKVHLVGKNGLNEELSKAFNKLDTPIFKWKKKIAFIAGKALSLYGKMACSPRK